MEIAQSIGMLETSLTGEPPFWETFDQFSVDSFPVHVLGREITKSQGLDTLKRYIRSRFWFTYRKNFSPIGGTGPSSDQGWGCMLRCAQMLLGETLLRRHLARHYDWKEGYTTENYERILHMFFDEKDALYSIHQIAQMGVSEGKTVGEWFGPNTAAQVIKKLTVFDNWSNISVHVALDNIVVRNDAITIATTYPPDDAVKIIMENGSVDKNHFVNRVDGSTLCDGSGSTSTSPTSNNLKKWRPLLLIIPLRLGLTTMNLCYLPAIQEFFKVDQCVGIIGGRPNHALYFFGFSGTKLLYLDPHYCRPKTSTSTKEYSSQTSKEETKEETRKDVPCVSLSDNDFSHLEDLEPLASSTSDGFSPEDDATYHCNMLMSMEFASVDPSLALAFFCETEKDFDKLSDALRKRVLTASSPPLFEQLDKRPSYWPPFEPYVGVNMKIEMKEFDDMGAPNYSIDDGFEVLETDGSDGDSDNELEKHRKSDE